MTPQETQALEQFLIQLTQARAAGKDPQAQAMIADAMARQPDAPYLLVQRALLLDHALASARDQIATLQGQLQAAQQAAQGTGVRSFLDADNAWGNGANGPNGTSRAAASAAAPAQTAIQPAVPSPVAYQNVPAQPARSGWLSGGLGGTLGSIATTAAGVAGGAFLFQGLENLFHRNSASNVLGQPDMAVLEQPNETVVNNYYGSDDRSSFTGTDLSSDQSSGNDFLDDGLSSDGFLDDDSSLV